MDEHKYPKGFWPQSHGNLPVLDLTLGLAYHGWIGASRLTEGGPTFLYFSALGLSGPISQFQLRQQIIVGGYKNDPRLPSVNSPRTPLGSMCPWWISWRFQA